jgi:flagella basal body P-ring formation protein FlgA
MVAATAAPPGYSRLINISDLVMYRIKPGFPGAAIATNDKKRITVQTSAVRFSLHQMRDSVYMYLDRMLSWKSGVWSFELSNDTLGWNGYPGPFSCCVSGLKSPYAKGSVVLTLLFTQGTRTVRIPVPCTINVKIPVLVASKEINRTDSFSQDNVTLEQTEITGFGPEPFTDFSEVKDHTATMTIKAGTILHKRMVQKQPDVIRGEIIAIIYNKGRVVCTVQGTARENGCSGEVIWVESGVTQRLLRVIVIGKGRAMLV